MCWSLSLFNSKYCEIFKSTCFQEHLQTGASGNVFKKLNKIKFIHNFTLKNRFLHQYQKQMNMFVFISWLVSYEVFFRYNISVVWWEINPKHWISKEDQKKMWNFDQWKTFPKNYKPMRIWLCLVCKFTENYCRSRLFSEFIQTQKRCPTSLDKMHILTWKLLVISC